jgi:hypothetical protein
VNQGTRFSTEYLPEVLIYIFVFVDTACSVVINGDIHIQYYEDGVTTFQILKQSFRASVCLITFRANKWLNG